MRCSAERAATSRRNRRPCRVGGVEYSLGVASLSDIGYRANQRHLWRLVRGAFVVVGHTFMVKIAVPTRQDDLSCYG
jgi:hypothetical protein